MKRKVLSLLLSLMVVSQGLMPVAAGELLSDEIVSEDYASEDVSFEVSSSEDTISEETLLAEDASEEEFIDDAVEMITEDFADLSSGELINEDVFLSEEDTEPEITEASSEDVLTDEAVPEEAGLPEAELTEIAPATEAQEDELSDAPASEEPELVGANSGKCGTNAQWKLESGILTISGSGRMYKYAANRTAPWYANRDEITDVVILSDIEFIGDSAFYNCKNLVNVTIASSVYEIGNSAFANCSSLKGISIPSNVYMIGWKAFANCTNMTTITIPSGVTHIDGQAFSGCSSLASIYFEGEAPLFTFTGDYGTATNHFAGVTATVYYPWKKAGWNSKIRLQYGGKIKWVPYPTPQITVKPAKVNALYLGRTQALEVSGLIPGDKIIAWESSNTDVAIVDSNGIVTAKNIGDTVITITLKSGLKKTINVHCTVPNNLFHEYVDIWGCYNSKNGADLHWNGVNNAQSYNIYRTNQGMTQLIATVDKNTKSYMDTSIKTGCWGKVYVYYVCARYGSFTQPRYPDLNGKTLQRIAPMKITSAVSDAKGKATIKWAVDGAENKAGGYELQYAESASDLFGRTRTFKAVGGLDKRTSLSKVVTGLKSGKTYYFRVRPYVVYEHSVTKVKTTTWGQYSPVVSLKIK
ncbi:MAG: leucine-rich repeat protein [Blautia sp.]|nr:leucine-rich repeat protein [Blautia sp.]